MSNYELIKNAKGYADPTAADTLNRKEPGDIWTYKDSLCLVIKNHGGMNMSTILELYDREKRPGNIMLTTSLGPKFVDPCFISYGFHQKMFKYFGTIDADEFAGVLEAVEDTLGLNLSGKERPQPDDAQEAEKLQAEVEQLRKQLEAQEIQILLEQAKLEAAEKAATKATNQLDLLRDMYGDLLTKMMED